MDDFLGCLMIKKNDWILQRLGIIQWKLKQHIICEDECSLILPSYIILLLIADPLPSLDHTLLHDVIRSLQLTLEQFCVLLPRQAKLISDRVRYHSWWIGIKPFRDFDGAVFVTPPLSVVCQSSIIKQDLWQQILSSNFSKT
ncbi:DNA polymerase III subunit psi [Blochmannia endosymbiont of Camponotus (Colobopsis) obliquus]|uniref:DNA polymerase III subunit psi n=1 Tax=Blochmannia endosymbiont of Camponotus (Colobopsis) obliquus TaxID=1505597 RepID=UPI00061A54AF|nr:DNA polymerase III subunit psi [Blochmannia endosymbiont of Camponotus (Colobopsis) obliquus]AKC60287.1 DNA polymerase III subunit psi [Blochmannia endosymbiont of Camponotus (Colobopsis) obliquus]